MEGYAGKTVAELRAISNAKGVFRVKTWRKNQLVNALTKFDKTDPANRRNVYLYKTIEQLHEHAKNKGIHTAKVWPKGKIINTLIAHNKTRNKKVENKTNKSIKKVENKNNKKLNAQPAPKNVNTMSVLPSWYQIKEIKPADFVKCIKPIYTVLEGVHKSKSNEDVFLKSMLLGHNKLTEEQWGTAEKARLAHKALEGKMGDFHEELMGCFPGYKNLPQGHSSGCDVASIDDMLFMEVKNRDNTLNSGGGAHVVAYLKKLTDAGKRGILVEVNCPGGRVARFGAHTSVEVWNGQKAYAFLSGREEFFNDLIKTLKYASENYMTYPELKSALETP